MNLHNAIRPTRLKSYQKPPPPPPTPHFFKASGDIAFSTIPQGVLSICSAGGKMLWLLGRLRSTVYHPLCQFQVNSSGIVWCEASNKYPYNTCIWRKTRWVGPIFDYDMTMSLLIWLWCLISEWKLLTYSIKKFMIIQVEWTVQNNALLFKTT